MALESGTPPLKQHAIQGHNSSIEGTISELTDSEQKTKELVEPLFQSFQEKPLSSRTDLLFTHSARQKSGISQKELNIEQEMEVLNKQLESKVEMEKKLEEVSGNSSNHLIEVFHYPSKLEASIRENMNRIKTGSSEKEKILAYGSLVGSLIDSAPLHLDIVENGAKDLLCEMFMKATELLGASEKTEPFCRSATILFAKIVGIHTEDRIQKYEKQLAALKSNDPRAEQLKKKIDELKNNQAILISGLNINDSVDFVKDNIEKAVKQLTPLFPKGEKTFANIWNFSSDACELIRLGASGVAVKQNYEALQMLYLMKESLEKQKAKLEKGGAGSPEKINELEKEIAEIEEKILYGQIDFAAAGISVFESVMKGLAAVLPAGSTVFSNFAGSLGLLSGAINLGGEGRSIAVRIKKIRSLCQRADFIELRCKQIQKEIEQLEKSGQSVKAIAKKILLYAMTVRLNTIRQIWVSHQVFLLSEDILKFAKSGQTIAKDLLVLLSASKAAIATAGTVGIGLIAANIILKFEKLLLFEKSSIALWKNEMQLAREQKKLRKEISKFRTSAIPVLHKFLNFDSKAKKIGKEELRKICKEELSNILREQQNLQKNLLENRGDIKKMREIKVEMQKNALLESAVIDMEEKIIDFKEENIPTSKLAEMKQEVFSRFTTPVLYEYESGEASLRTRKMQMREEFEKAQKLELLGLSEEEYYGFRKDLQKLLDSPQVLFELSEQVKQDDPLLAQAIFGQKEVNLDLLVDYFIPPVGSEK